MLYKIAAPIIQSRMRFFDANGKPLVGGKVYSFKVGTGIFKPTYRDAQRTALNQNPVVLDNEGSALIYLLGSHVLKIYDKNGNFIEQIYVPEAQMTTQFFDKFGKPLSFGKVWTYDIASTIKKTSFANADQAQPNPNPIILDADGKASISMIGSYRLRTYNEKNVHLGDQDFQRPVARALTSRVYPIYFEEGLSASLTLLEARRILPPDASENISAVFALLGATVREPTNTTNIDESIENSFALQSATVRETLNTTNLNETISNTFLLNSAMQRTALITIIAENESIENSFTLLGAQITN